MKKSLQVNLYTFFYKQAPIVFEKPPYIPVMAGNANSKVEINMLGDDTGINISEKNKYYSELSGTYWVWKNTKQDIIGVVHYRRFFTNKKEPFIYRIKRFLYYPVGIYYKRYGLIYTKNINLFKKRIITQHEIINLLEHYDLILPVRRRLKYTVQEHFKRYHNHNGLQLLRLIIHEMHPEYIPSYEKVLSGRHLYANNMFIMKQIDFEESMNWLFSILFEFENRINLSDYKEYQERILGFVAERLLNIWVIHKKPKIIELPVIYFKHLKYS